MARMTGEDFCTNIRGLCGGETAETLSDNKILRAVNQELLRIVSQYDIPLTQSSTPITTVSGTAEYEVLVSDILRVTSVHDSTNGFNLRAMLQWQYLGIQGASSSGQPVQYYISGVGANDRFQITLWPTPDGVYTINVYYSEKPEEIVKEPVATSSYLPEVWDSVIELRAAAKCWLYLHDGKQAAYCLQLGIEEEKAAAMISVYGSESPARPQSIAGYYGRQGS